MTHKEIRVRLAQSKLVFDGWEAIGRPSGKLDDLLEMIGKEVAILERIAIDHEDWVVPANFLIGRYRAFQKRLRAMAN